jgi:hypothetical protein
MSDAGMFGFEVFSVYVVEGVIRIEKMSTWWRKYGRVGGPCAQRAARKVNNNLNHLLLGIMPIAIFVVAIETQWFC